jgi:hypothetical protein
MSTSQVSSAMMALLPPSSRIDVAEALGHLAGDALARSCRNP